MGRGSRSLTSHIRRRIPLDLWTLEGIEREKGDVALKTPKVRVIRLLVRSESLISAPLLFPRYSKRRHKDLLKLCLLWPAVRN